ncbi:MAG: tripartite tricarboxylate transporter substrate binding protein [Betaproteobacteria bacterium]|nr:tripartite tricarboxylate transporter substrate binding protein [Betaproteobacteria bacterium]
MTIPRRRFLQLAGLLSAATAVPRIARSQAYPARPLRWIVGFPPGGAADIVVRLIGEALSGRLGQQVIVDNRPGAGTNIAAEAVVRAPADGYTLLLVGPANAINATLYEKLPFNFLRDIAPVAGLNRSPMVMLVQPSSPFRTVAEFIAHAKSNPGKLSVASGGNGTASQMAGGLFKMMAGVNFVDVPYRGEAPALVDLRGGQVQAMFVTLTSGIEYARNGSLRALAVTTATRAQALPDVPSVADFVPGYESSTWNGVGTPRNTPAEIIARLNREINAVLADAKIKARFAGLGATPLPISPAEFGNLVETETAKWMKVVKFLGLRPN